MKIWCVDYSGLSHMVHSTLFFTKAEAENHYDALPNSGCYKKMYQVEDIWGWCGRHFVKVINEVLTSRDDGDGATFIYGMCNEIREAASCCGLKQYSVDGFWVSESQFILSLAWFSGDKLEHHTFSLTGRDDTYISLTIVERRSKWENAN